MIKRINTPPQNPPRGDVDHTACLWPRSITFIGVPRCQEPPPQQDEIGSYSDLSHPHNPVPITFAEDAETFVA
ncbi:(NiFe) hydrogenase maturation protein HypF [Anopheles sinensis]|uniref:(NiFe) hydrogenase maturation protein HypF n=1 Tax=Anopheles sinensis TaxID=74873 RepID=A0A084VXN2_ANOSI|nr:(NiFe) hydrogenase maturation protein HypF [Anopheles sinensis]